MSEDAYSVFSPRRDTIDMIVVGDILFDEVLTESFCQVRLDSSSVIASI